MQVLNNVVSLQREINRVKRQIDDMEWEGQDSKPLKRHLIHLLELEDDGDIWYPMF